MGINHVHNGDLRKLKNLYIRSQKNKVRRSNYGGYVTLPYKKHCGNKRSCVQDAFANLSKLFGFEMKELIYKHFEPEEYRDTDINKVLKHPLITNRFFIKEISTHGRKGGPEYWFYTNILPLGGKYIIKCHVHNTLNKRIENHVFVIDADYKEAKHNVAAALINNQATNKLTGIQKSDLKDENSARRICGKLYGEKTYFLMIWQVELRKYRHCK